MFENEFANETSIVMSFLNGTELADQIQLKTKNKL